MVNNDGDRVMVPEKVVSPKKKKVLTFLSVTCNATRDQHKLIHVAVVPRNLFSFYAVPTDKQVWETLMSDFVIFTINTTLGLLSRIDFQKVLNFKTETEELRPSLNLQTKFIAAANPTRLTLLQNSDGPPITREVICAFFGNGPHTV